MRKNYKKEKEKTMNETLEKEVLKEEKSSSNTIFETILFKEVFNDVKDVQGEIRQELKGVLLDGMRKFVKEEITNTEPINWEAVELAFFAGIATVLGGDIAGDIRKQEKCKTNAIKRVIRKDNLIGFYINYEDTSDETGGVVMPKEQYDEMIAEGKTLTEIVLAVSPQNKKIKEVYQMSEAELNKNLDILADKLINREFEE